MNPEDLGEDPSEEEVRAYAINKFKSLNLPGLGLAETQEVKEEIFHRLVSAIEAPDSETMVSNVESILSLFETTEKNTNIGVKMLNDITEYPYFGETKMKYRFEHVGMKCGLRRAGMGNYWCCEILTPYMENSGQWMKNPLLNVHGGVNSLSSTDLGFDFGGDEDISTVSDYIMRILRSEHMTDLEVEYYTHEDAVAQTKRLAELAVEHIPFS